MKALKLVLLAARYLSRYKRRYFFLFLALGVGFSVITAITALKAGMTERLYLTAQSHYAGDIIVLGKDNDASGEMYRLGQKEIDAVLSAAAPLVPDRVVLRTNFIKDAYVYFNGNSSRLKYVNGVDWDAEAPMFAGFTYAEPPLAPLSGDDEILISSPVARLLGVRRGDSVVLELNTYLGQRNTASFVVAGIIEDKTIFGFFKSYVSRSALNRLIDFKDGECSAIGFYFNDADESELDAAKRMLHAELSGVIDTSAPLNNRADYETQMLQSWSGIRAFVIDLAVYLSDVDDLLGAMDILAYLLFAMMLVIVFVSALVTYKLILFERAQELGTMRVLGFQEGDITIVLILETVMLVLLSVIAGFLFSIALVRIFSALPFAAIPGFEMFMKDGRLFARYRFLSVLLNALSVFLVLLPALGIPAYRASRGNLPQMLKGSDS